MSSKVLQTPQIIAIIGSTIRVAHPSTEGMISTQLGSPIASGGTTMTVLDNNGLINAEYLVVGKIGSAQAEIVAINGAITRGTALTVANTLAFGHELQAPVTRVYERGFKIYGAATDGGVGTLIASVDAIASPIADAVLIQWDKQYSEYTLLSSDTAYAYYYVVFTDGTTVSGASAYVAATGADPNTVESLSNQALVMTNSEVDEELLTRTSLIQWAQEGQDAIAQFTYLDSQSGRRIQKNWSFEVILDSALAAVQNKTKYDLSSLTRKPKTRGSDTSIISVRVGNSRPRIKTQLEQYDRYMEGTSMTLLNGAASIGAVTLTVDSTADFNTSGSITVGVDTITYTGKTATQFTGIPASGSGSITVAHADNLEVWQGNSQGMPVKYCIDGETLMFDVPFNSTNAGKNINIRMFAEMPKLTKLSDKTLVTFYNVLPYYIAYKIMQRKEQLDVAATFLATFKDEVTNIALADRVPTSDTQTYYVFGDPLTEQAGTLDPNNSNSYYRF